MSSLFSSHRLLRDSSGAEAPWGSLAPPSLKVVALYFSAHWCPPCRQFTPMLKQAWNQAKGRLKTKGSVQVVFV